MEAQLPALLANYDRPTNKPTSQNTGRRGESEATPPAYLNIRYTIHHDRSIAKSGQSFGSRPLEFYQDQTM